MALPHPIFLVLHSVQAWEYQPLGPFLSKNFASTLSPWVVTLDALAPFRAPFTRPESDPEPSKYLDSPVNRAYGAINIELEVWLQTARMHQTVNGCNLRAADLFGSGTLSGPKPEQGGSLMELSAGGKQPFALSNGETRSWLEDGDSVILRGYYEREGFRRIEFGEYRGTVLAASALQ